MVIKKMLKLNKTIWLGTLLGLIIGIVVNVLFMMLGNLDKGSFAMDQTNILIRISFLTGLGAIIGAMIYAINYVSFSHFNIRKVNLKYAIHSIIHLIIWGIFVLIILTAPAGISLTDMVFLGLFLFFFVIYLGSGILFDNIIYNLYDNERIILRIVFILVVFFASLPLFLLMWALTHYGLF